MPSNGPLHIIALTDLLDGAPGRLPDDEKRIPGKGLDGLEAPPDVGPCFLNPHLKATIVSWAPRADLEKLHQRVVTHNMVLGALRGVPMTSELSIVAA